MISSTPFSVGILTVLGLGINISTHKASDVHNEVGFEGIRSFKYVTYSWSILLTCIVLQVGTRNIEVELTTVSSNHHVELNPSDAGFQDRYVVQEIIKEMAKNGPIDGNGTKGFKVLVLNEFDKAYESRRKFGFQT